MKGIFKKLFLGLFLCALICAGFSKNVKADATVSGVTVEYAKATGVKITVTMSGAGTGSESIPLCMDYSDATGTPTTQIGTIVWDTDKWKFNPEGAVGNEYQFNSATGSTDNKLVLEAANSNAQLEAIRGCAQTNYGNVQAIKKVFINVTGSSEGRSVTVVNPKVTVNAPEGIPSVYNSPATETDFKVEYNSYPSSSNNWVVEGEEYKYKLVGNTPKGSSYMESAHKQIGSAGHTEDSGYFTESINATTASNPSITYTYLPVTTIGLDYDFDGVNILAGKDSDPRKVELDKGVTNSTWANYSSSTNSEVRLSYTSGSTATPTTLDSTKSFTVTPGAAKEYTLTVSVFDTKIDPDTAQKTQPFEFKGANKPSNLKFDPTSYTVAEGYTKQTHVYLGATEVTDDCTFSSSKDTVAEVDDYGEITGIAKSSSPVTITAYYDWANLYEGATGGDPIFAKASVKVGSGSTGGTLKFSSDPVCVSEGCEVNLVDFMTTDDKTMDVDVSFEGGIAKLGSKITTPEELKKVKIKGTKAGKKTDGITVWPFGDEGSAVTADLKVYPAPSVSTGSSGGFGSFNSSSSSSNAGLTISVPASTYHGGESDWVPSVKYAFVTFNSLSSGKSTTLRGSVSGTTSSDSKTATVSLATVSNEISKIAKGDNDQIYVEVNPESAESDMLPDKAVSGVGILNAFKIELKGDSATYKVNGESVKDYFYAIADQEYTIESVAKNSGDKFQKWEGDESSTAKIDKIKFSSPRTLHAVYGNSSSSSSSSSSSKLTANGTGTGADSEGLDDVPKTGESKTDIWILWTVLLVSILGAGFMIYRRFGVVNAIAQAQADETAAIEQEKIDAEVKEKEDKLRVLKNLRNLK